MVQKKKKTFCGEIMKRAVDVWIVWASHKSRGPVKVSILSGVCVCSSGSHKFEIYVHLSFFSIFRFWSREKEPAMPPSRVLSTLVN